MSNRIVLLLGCALLLLTLALPAASASADSGFVTRSGNVLKLNGAQFRFAGTNNYYLMYKSRAMVDDVLESAADNDFRVVRTWGWLDIGNQDGSDSVAGKADGVYFQYWNGSRPAYNDGDDGLKRLDYVIAKARAEGIRLVIPFTNNWRDFGGMDQYVKWRGAQYHDDFYTDPVIRGWYRDWIAHVLNRTNSITGIRYSDDPTIMTWELANEPRCVGSGVYPRSSRCTTQTITGWAAEMSAYIKSIDSNHLVSVGDEGFYCVPNAADWIDNCGEGIDTIALTRLPHIDVMSFHLYPDGWGNRGAAWGTQWIERHVRDAKANGKASMLGEFGFLNKNARNAVYKEWTDAVFKSGGQSGGDGALYWILSGKQDDGSLYADYDGFTVYAGTPVFSTLGNFADMMNANRRMSFPPVADHDSAVTEFETTTTLTPLANDVTYGGATLNARSIDLDPAADGQQTTKAVAGGTFAWQSGGSVVFTPTAGFAGKAAVSYTVRDSSARLSNVATITVTVKPNPGAAITLFSFESGTEGWSSPGWEAGKASASQSTEFHTDGSASLQVNVNADGWFGISLTPPINLSDKTHLKFDIKAGGNGTSTDVAIVTGDSYTWRQFPSTAVGGGSTATIDVDMLSTGAEPTDFAKVQQIYIYLKTGTHYIDFVRAE